MSEKEHFEGRSVDERPQRRAVDQGALCRIARIASLAWDWFDNRLILERAVAVAIVYGTVNVLAWAKGYAESHESTEAATIIGAVLLPYMALQGAAVKFMFDRIK